MTNFCFRLGILWCAIFCTTQINAQHLTISTGGESGTSGTNWNISGNTLNVAASGSANIHPSVITNHLTNTGDLTINLPWQSGITRDIYINNTIAYTGGNARTLTINAANDIIVASGVSISSSTAAMNLVLRSAIVSGGPDHGRIQLNGSTITTNGGHFWAGAGITNTTWNNLTVGNNYSVTWADDIAGISFIGATLNSNGGNIYMAGRSYNTSDGDGENYGINIRNSSITSGAGQIDILGDLKGMYGTGSGLGIFGNSGTVTISSTTGAINLTGTGVDQSGTNTGWRRAVLLYTLSTSPVSVTSTSGNITITGTAAFPVNTNDDMIGIQLGSTQAIADGVKITSQSGNILLTGSNTRENAGQNSNAVQFIAANVSNSIRIGSDGTNPYSGNITIEGNSIIQNNVNAGSGSISVQSTGTLTVQPLGNAFTYLRSSTSGSLTFDDDWNFGTTLSGFTFGKSTNTLDLSYGRPLTVAGPITFHVGNFTINENISASSASAITINARGNFNTDNVSRQTISSNNGNISIIADSDANGIGILDLDRLTINPGSGNIIVRGEAASWGVGSVDGPFINGTGGFTFESSDASFGQDMYTSWFEIDQDGNGISALTFGKSGSTQNVYQNTNLTIAGPVSYIGGTIGINGVLTATNSDISLRATSPVTQTQPITANGLSLNGTGTFTLTNTSNNFTTLAGGAIGTLIGATQIVDASGGLTIGTVGSNTGLIGSSTIRVETLAGNLTLTGSISTTSTSTDAVILTAAKNTAIGVPTGGDILVSGSPTITMGTGAIAKLFSGYDVTSTGLTALAGGASNARYNYDETTTTFNPTLSANNRYAIYRTGLGYGNLNIVSAGGDAEGTTWTYSSGVITTTSGTVNILNTDIQSKLSLANLNVEADRITFSANITSNNANALSFLSKTHILNTNATTITTQGGNVLFASNVDDATDGETTTNGYIQLRNGITINTNGGNITFGGGNTSGSDYALGSSVENYTEGVRFDALVALNSAGGNITLRGKSYARSVQLGYGASGVGFYFFTGPAGTINSGSGTINIDGFSQTNTSDYASGIYSMHNMTITSANTTADAIRLIGKATGASGQAWGIETENIFSVIATGIGGGITISTSQQLVNNYDAVFRGETNILAVSGPINIKSGQFGGTTNGYLYLNGHMHLGSKAGSAVTSSSSNIVLQFDRLAYDNGAIPKIGTSGSVTFQPNATSFGMDIYSSYFNFNQNSQTMTNFTFGKSGNAGNLYLNSAFTVAGPINVYGGYVDVSNTITSSANGDILLKGINDANASVFITAGGITKTNGAGTLTMQGHGRTHNAGTISATGTGVLNVIMWSDFDGNNVGGGATNQGTISTNGGHVWMGGSNSNGGSYTWNGLSVGDGPSVGASGANANALDMFGPITTNGGDLLLWAGTGFGGSNGIVANAGWQLNVGGGDIVLITNVVLGVNGVPLFFRQTGGTFTMVPNSSSFPSAVNWYPDFGTYGPMAGWNFIGDFEYLWIDNPSALTNLTIGRYDGMTNGSSPVVFSNTSNINFNLPTTIAGSMNFYGGALTLSSNLATTNTTLGDILLQGTSISGTGNISLAAGRNVTVNVSATSTYDGIISGTGSSLTKLGAGLLTLTKDHTYSGLTTISAGDLQVGTGGSVSQASGGTINNTSAVTIASGSKLILAPNENVIFSAPISGDGGVEIKGMSGAYYNSFLTGTAATMVTNSTVLEVLTRITGGLQAGQAVSGGGTKTAGAYIKSYNAATNTATLQFQQYDGTYTKCVFAQLSQSGTNVQIRGNTSIYSGAAYRNGNHLGVDMSSGSIGIGALATSAAASGYGISNVYMSGKVNFTGNLTYTGNTVLSNTVTNGVGINIYSYTSKGTQEITDASSSFPPTSTVINNGLVIFNRSTPLTITSNMQGTEEVLQVGADITLTGTNTHTGITTIDLNKTLNVGSGGTSGSMTGNIINYGTLTFNRSDSSSYIGVISGSGTLTKLGASDLTLTGLNTYTGSSTISAGRLVLQRDVPATSSSSYSGAGILVIQPNANSFTSAVTYPIPGFNVSSSIGGLIIGKFGNTANITVSSATTAAGQITLYGGTITLNNNLTTSNNGAISFYSDNAIAGLTAPRNVSAAGLFNYIPQSNSFGAAVTYPITNLNVSCTGLLIGKATNTANVTFGNTTAINGPITAYGGTISVNENVSSSAGSNISLFGNSLTFASGKTVTSTGELLVAPQSESNTIGIAGASGTLQLPASYFSTNFTDGFSNITIGSDNQTGNISSNALTLQDPLTIKTSGNLTLGGSVTMENNNVTLSSFIASISGMPSNYLKTTGTGVVKRSLPNTNTFAFPVGNTAYNPVSITNNSGSSDDFTVRVLDEVYANGLTGAAISTTRIKRTWDIGKANANSGSGVDFVFNWNSGEESSTLYNPSLYHYESGAWVEKVPTTSSSSATSYTFNGYTGTFSPFYVGDQQNPLPVTLIDFTVACEENQPVFEWSTAAEINNHYFSVDQSKDQNQWQSVVQVAGAGNSNVTTIYRHVLQNFNLANGRYFRLRQVDYNGTEEVVSQKYYSGCDDMSNGLVVFPNPANEQVQVQQLDANTEVQLVNALGAVIQILQSNSAGQITITLPDEIGVYYIRGIQQGMIVVQKVMKV